MQKEFLDQQRELIGQWSKLTKTGFDSLKELGEINGRLVERLSQQQLEIVNASLEATVKETQLLTQSKGYKDLVDNQSALSAEYNRRFLDIVRRTTDILTQARDELSAWVERGVEQVEQGVRRAERSFERGVERAEEGAERVARGAERAAKSAEEGTERPTGRRSA